MTKPSSSLFYRIVLALSLTLVIPLDAQAHAILVESQPAIGGTVPAGPVDFRLRYNSRIDHARSRLTLTLPDRSQKVLLTPPDDPVDILTTKADLAPGAYSLRWQVLAIDGHITRGDVPFSVTAPASASAHSAAAAGD